MATQNLNETLLADLLKLKIRQFKEEIENQKTNTDKCQKCLEHEVTCRKKAESIINEQSCRIQCLERDLAIAERHASDAKSKLMDATKKAYEGELIGWSLTNRNQIKSEKIQSLEMELSQAKEMNKEINQKFQDASHALVRMEQQLQRSDQMCKLCDGKIVELNIEQQKSVTVVKFLENSKETGQLEEAVLQNQVTHLRGSLKNVESRVQLAEQMIRTLQEQLTTLTHQLTAERAQTSKLQKQLDGVLDEEKILNSFD